MAKLQQGVNDLYTWCLNNEGWGQQILREWTGLDGNNQPVSMNNIARASGKKVKWRCNNGHEWAATIVGRTNNRVSCPYCSGLLVLPENSLKTWCLNNGKWGQQLINEWTGLDENNQPV